MNKICLKYIVCIVFTTAIAHAQHLHRKGSLGIEYKEASDSLLKVMKVYDTKGIVVNGIKNTSTAANLGLQVGDILVAVNDIDSLYLFDFQRLEKNLNENEPITVTYWRGRRKNRVVGKVLPAPKELSYGEVLYDEVAYNRGYLRSIVHKPLSTSKAPAIFYLQDFDCSSIDMADDSLAPLKQLVDGWVQAGYVVYRLEKPGIGESQGTKDCSRINYIEELNAFENGFAHLKKLSFVDSTRILFFGHGVGGITAPLIAQKSVYKPKGIMVYGTIAKTWFEYMIDTFRDQPQLFKVSPTIIDINTRMLTPLLYEWVVKGQGVNELIQNPDFEAILTSSENPLHYRRGLFWGRSPQYFSNLNQQNILQAWATINLPTLAIHGEYDYKAISDSHAKTIVNTVNENKASKATFKMLKQTDHHFALVDSYEQILKLDNTNSYQNYIRKNFNKEFITTTINWMKQF